MRTTARLREWGSSIGLVVPIEAVRKEGLRPGDEVVIEIERAPTLRDLFGIGKGLKLDAQKMKDEIRKEDARSDARLEAFMNRRRRK